MKHQALFSSRDKSKKLKCRLLQFLFGALRVMLELLGQICSAEQCRPLILSDQHLDCRGVQKHVQGEQLGHFHFFLPEQLSHFHFFLPFQMGVSSERKEFAFWEQILSFKGRFLLFRMYHNFTNLFSKLSESTFFTRK